MTKWSVYQSSKDYENKTKSEMDTFSLINFLLFGSKDYIVTINKKKIKE